MISLRRVRRNNSEFKKNLDSAQNAIEKLKKERDELWANVNTDKYKNLS